VAPNAASILKLSENSCSPALPGGTVAEESGFGPLARWPATACNASGTVSCASATAICAAVGPGFVPVPSFTHSASVCSGEPGTAFSGTGTNSPSPATRYSTVGVQSRRTADWFSTSTSRRTVSNGWAPVTAAPGSR